MNTNLNRNLNDLYWSCDNCKYKYSLQFSDNGCFDGDCPAWASYHDPIRSRDRIKADLDTVKNCPNKGNCILMADDLNTCHLADLCKSGQYSR